VGEEIGAFTKQGVISNVD